jgi:hypothetical protein
LICIRECITIDVKVVFQILKMQKIFWVKEFSNWGDYESTSGGFTQRDLGISSATDKITDDILLEVISNW